MSNRNDHSIIDQNLPRLSSIRFAEKFATIQDAINDCEDGGGVVVIPATYSRSDTFTNDQGVPVLDLRRAGTFGGGWVNALSFGADPTGATDSAAAIQTAIDLTPAGGTVVLPTGTYLVASTLLISKSLSIVGTGWGVTAGFSVGTLIKLSPTASNTTDVFLVQPTGGATISVRFAELSIFACDGVHGRYGINFDGAGGDIAHSVLDHVEIASFSPGASINGTGNALGNGTPALSSITRCHLTGGIRLATCGDSVRVTECTFAADTGKALDVSFIAGASTFVFERNLVFCDGGIHVGTLATALHIVDNEFETGAAFVGSNGAYIDVDGTSGSHAREVMIQGNSFQIVNGVTTDTIRVNFADRTYIAGNRFDRGATTSHDIVVTANATDTFIGHNLWVDGGPFASMLSNAGTHTQAVFVYPGNDSLTLLNNTNLDWIDEAGNRENVLAVDASGAVALCGYHSNILIYASNGSNQFFEGNTASLAIDLRNSVSAAAFGAAAIATIAAVIAKRFIASARVVTNWAATIAIDANLGNLFEVPATSNIAHTVGAPTNPTTGQRITVKVKNTSGGALAATGWNAIFKMAAWVDPANGFSASITFHYDGTNWVEEGRGGTTIPN